ncbi:hypothetical protein IAI18_05950 [Acetobacteraceae bacterium H6797]|nr:hypothetical protein [Acetobacteraceae bacterium H6797]
MSRRNPLLAALLAAPLAAFAGQAGAQQLDMTKGGPVEVTSSDGIEWRQDEQVVIARGNARAVRDGVTLDADRIIARYRPRAGQTAPATPEAAVGGAVSGSSSEIWRLEAEGNVRITSQDERAQGERAVYDMDRAVMVMTGGNLQLTNPDNTITARDSLEYWPQRRMAVARGNALVVTKDGRRIASDVLVSYFLDQGAPAPRATARQGGGTVPGSGSRIDRVEVFGNVEIRTAAEVVRGDRGVYSPVTALARLLGNVRITRGENQLHGQEAIVNMQTNVARLVAAPGQRVQGVVMPNSAGPQQGNQPGNQAPAGRQP